MSVGNRVFLQRDLPDPQVMEEFRSLPAANVADTMGRSCALSSEIHLISNPKDSIMVGAAFTVKARPGDNLMLHKALDLAGENDVIVVSNEGDRSQSLMGEIMAIHAQHNRKIRGIVLDGPIRDYEDLSQLDQMFLYATGSTPGGPYKEGPGEINVPVCCGGVAVLPGDIVVGDEDGVVFIRKEDAPLVIEEAIKKFDSETKKLERYASVGLEGDDHQKKWIKATEKIGVAYFD